MSVYLLCCTCLEEPIRCANRSKHHKRWSDCELKTSGVVKQHCADGTVTEYHG